MTVYLLTRKGVLHKGSQVNGEHQVFEACNLDSAKGVVVYQDELTATVEAKKLCKRCFHG